MLRSERAGMSGRLAELPGYWINLDRSPHRKALFEERMLPVVPRVERLSAVDARELPLDAVRRFHARKCGRDEETHTLRQYETLARGELACAASHMRALYAGIAAGHERFLVFEDDAVPSWDYYDHLTATPVEDIILHGSYGMALVGENESWKSKRREVINYRPLHTEGREGKKLHVYCTHAYEVTRQGALVLYEEICKADHALDVMWWRAFRRVSTSRANPPIFLQDTELGRDIKEGEKW